MTAEPFADHAVERLALLNDEAGAGVFDVHAALQQERRTGFEFAFEPPEGFRKYQRLEAAGHILQAEDSPAVALAGTHRTRGHHHARQR